MAYRYSCTSRHRSRRPGSAIPALPDSVASTTALPTTPLIHRRGGTPLYRKAGPAAIFGGTPAATRLPEVSPPPVLARGRPRFGSFNKPQKINDAVIAAWSRILTELPDAELVMVVPGGDQTDIRDLFRHLFSGHGVKPERVQVVGRCGLAGFLRLVAEVDIALDTFPYCGSTTTFLSLWMGVPTIALTGDNAAAKVTAGMMEVCELGDLTATEVDGYVRAACTLARNPTRLNQLRPLLRRRIAESSLMLAATFTCCLEAEYRIWWRRFVDPAGPRRPGRSASPTTWRRNSKCARCWTRPLCRRAGLAG